MTYHLFVSGVDSRPDSASPIRCARPRRPAPAPSRSSGSATAAPARAPQRQLAVAHGRRYVRSRAAHRGHHLRHHRRHRGCVVERRLQDWFFGIYRGWLSSRSVLSRRGQSRQPAIERQRRRVSRSCFHFPTQRCLASVPGSRRALLQLRLRPGAFHRPRQRVRVPERDAPRGADCLAGRGSRQHGAALEDRVLHRSPYSAGGEHGSDLAVRSAFGPIFERHNVQLVLSAHEHVYERTRPIREGSSGSEVTYLVTGGGGAPLYPAGTAGMDRLFGVPASLCPRDGGRMHAARGCHRPRRRRFDGATLERCSSRPHHRRRQRRRGTSSSMRLSRRGLSVDCCERCLCGGRQAAAQPRCRRREDHRRAAVPGELLRFDVRRAGGRAIPPLGSRPGR